MARICQHKHRSFEEKKLILEKYLLSEDVKNMHAKEYSSLVGVPYHTFMAWGRKIDWDETRLEELRTSRKKAKKSEGKFGIDEAEQTKILGIAEKFPNWGPLKVKQYLWRHEQVLLPQTSIYRFMKSKGLVRERDRAEAGHNRRFEYASPMACVQMDLMYVHISSGEKIYLVTLLDDYSRYVLVSRFIGVKTMDEVIDVFKVAIRSYGVMDVLLTDCGSEFVSWKRFTRFEELMVDLDVRYIASGPNKKETQGKVERWHQSVRGELRNRGPLDYSSEAQVWIQEVVNMYNFERPHQGIGGLVPADRFFGMKEEIEAELARCQADHRQKRKMYLVCRMGDHKMVISGNGSDELSLLMDGQIVSGEATKISTGKNQLKSVPHEGGVDVGSSQAD